MKIHPWWSEILDESVSVSVVPSSVHTMKVDGTDIARIERNRDSIGARILAAVISWIVGVRPAIPGGYR